MTKVKTEKYVLIKGKHEVVVDGERVQGKIGQAYDLTPDQVAAFGDKFVSAGEYKARLAYQAELLKGQQLADEAAEKALKEEEDAQAAIPPAAPAKPAQAAKPAAKAQ